MGAYFEEADVEVTSGALKAHQFHSAESGRWTKMEFCPTCGTTITWTGEVLPGMRAITVGTLDDPNWIKPKIHAWTRSALHWVVFPSDVELEATQRK
jgi:hypothetical protein